MGVFMCRALCVWAVCKRENDRRPHAPVKGFAEAHEDLLTVSAPDDPPEDAALTASTHTRAHTHTTLATELSWHRYRSVSKGHLLETSGKIVYELNVEIMSQVCEKCLKVQVLRTANWIMVFSKLKATGNSTLKWTNMLLGYM